MRLLNGFLILDESESSALSDLTRGDFSKTTVSPVDLRGYLCDMKAKAVAAEDCGDQVLMLSKEVIVQYADRLLDRMDFLGV